MTSRPAALAAALAAALLPAVPLPYEGAPVTDGGSIDGKVTFSGSPSTKKVIPTKDRQVCGAIRDEQDIVVGADKGVLDAVVWLKDVPKGKPMPRPAKPAEINNVGCKFEPRVQAAPVGELVIVNSDPVLHNTHGFLGKATVFNVALPTKGQRIERPLRKPGLMRVECDAHGWMLGWVLVTENPYHAVTKADGAFSITDVPPGSYTLVAWHEATGQVELPVTVKAKEKVRQAVELKR